jgi:hypothetical protein
MPSFETAARSLKVVPITAPVHSDVEIETAIIALGREPGGGLVLIPDAFTNARRAPIISAAARNNVPAVYSESGFARDGGLLSYGPDPVDNWPRAATYVDRILRGEKPCPGQLAFLGGLERRSWPDETERVLAEIDPDYGNFAVNFRGHGVLLCLRCPGQLASAGRGWSTAGPSH